MIAVITGDIVASRELINQDKWMKPLKKLLGTWGKRDRDWILYNGDYFQVEINKPSEVLKKALEIKALIKKVEPLDDRKKISTIDVRMAIGIGEKSYTGEVITENNGPAYINSGEKYELKKKENIKLSITSPWPGFDEEMNLYLKLAGLFMDKWSVSSAELVQIILKNPTITQEEIGHLLGIKQNSVSGRWNRAHVNEILEVENMFRKKIKTLLP